jgi:hypothetical protein
VAINPDSFVSWGLWTSGGTTTDKMACGFVSWGLKIALPAVTGAVNWLKKWYWWGLDQWGYGQ